MSVEPFNRLVKLAARAFYDDITTKGENLPKTGRSDNRGIAVVVLDALTRRQWVREDDLAKDLKLHLKQLRRTLRFFEEEKIVARDHRRETAKGARVYGAAIAATGDGQSTGREGEEKIKLHTHSYCCLDYAQIYDVVRYRLHRMRKKLKDELENKNTIQEYICPNCNKRYTALDASRLVSPYDEYFHCESCDGELVAESDKLAAQEAGDGDDNARRRRREKLNDMLQKMEVEVSFAGLDGKEDVKPEIANASLKVLPPWMIKQGMNLTKEQKGEVKEEGKVDGTSGSSTLSNDKKSAVDSDDKKSIQDEYVKAYYAALLKKQQELEEFARKQQELLNTANGLDISPSRQVGVKSKREEDEGEEDVEWEETHTTGNSTAVYRVHDLNVEAAASSEEEDDIDWEEG